MELNKIDSRKYNLEQLEALLALLDISLGRIKRAKAIEAKANKRPFVPKPAREHKFLVITRDRFKSQVKGVPVQEEVSYPITVITNSPKKWATSLWKETGCKVREVK